MTEHETLARLKSELDLAQPVKPLRSPGVRALVPAATGAALVALVPLVLGRREDVVALGDFFGTYVGWSVLQLACAVMLIVAGLRLSIPGRATSVAMVLASAAFALGAHLVAANAAVMHGMTTPAAGHEWQAGLACVSAVAVLGLLPVAWAALALREGLVTRVALAYASIGLAGAVAAEAAWRLHCNYSAWSHVLVFHTGAVVALAVVTAGVARFAIKQPRAPYDGV